MKETPKIGESARIERNRIVRTGTLAYPVQKVWDRLTDPEAIERWWGHPASFPEGMVAGSLGTFAYEGQTFPILIRAFEPPRLWEFTWGNLGETEPGETATDIAFNLLDAGGGRTAVTIVESSWERYPFEQRADRMAENAQGWNRVLDALNDDLDEHP